MKFQEVVLITPENDEEDIVLANLGLCWYPSYQGWYQKKVYSNYSCDREDYPRIKQRLDEKDMV